MALLLKKRFLSSPWALSRTLVLYEAARSGPTAARFDEDDFYAEVLGSAQSDEEEGRVEQPEFEALRDTRQSDPLVAADPHQIDRLIAWGRGYEHRPDTRLQSLLTLLKAVCRPDGRTWSNERVVVFTEYAATLEWIKGVLTQNGFESVLATIQGSTPAEDREQIRARFTAPPTEDTLRVLLATDAAGEGIDLQNYCHRLLPRARRHL